MAVRVSSRFATQDENAAVTAKSAQKSIGSIGTIPGTGLRPRQKLSNITNIQQLQTPQHRAIKPQLQTPQQTKIEITSKCAPTTAGAKTRKKLANITNKIQQQEQQHKSPQEQQRKLPAGPFPISKELEARAEEWAKAGIEKVHFTGDEMEALREKQEHEEMDRRVKAVLSFRTEIFPTFSRPAPATEDPYDTDGNLKLDTYEATNKVDADDVFGADELDYFVPLPQGDWLALRS